MRADGVYGRGILGFIEQAMRNEPITISATARRRGAFAT